MQLPSVSLLLLAAALSVSARAPEKQKCEGNFNIKNDDDFAKIVPCSEIKGKVFIDHTKLTEADLPNLQTLDGCIKVISNAELETLALPRITTITGVVEISNNPQLSTIDFNGLQVLGKSLTLTANPSVSSPNFPELSSVGENVLVAGETKVTNFNYLPALQSVGKTMDIRGSFDTISLNSTLKAKNMVLVSSSKLGCAEITKNWTPMVEDKLKCFEKADKAHLTAGSKLPNGAITVQASTGVIAASVMLIAYLAL
ncbi:hypothetical protein IWQ60_010701 [Tieghemiomyces parasiticus]|uniref:Uncharacterized protein n=1 Tax=Tieghemiomyces parasiticus TaxID=78921 RepID=A0A9W7ZL18_9FUNG|nr:hypothetical protein IWQ60_010701 [Tieghemiomyces parasiticus]